MGPARNHELGLPLVRLGYHVEEGETVRQHWKRHNIIVFLFTIITLPNYIYYKIS